MVYVVLICALFVLGSLVGYIVEVFYRRFFSAKRWVNPGFMYGPYIPLYGFGVVILYGISNIDLVGMGLPTWAAILIHIAAIGISLTLIELIAGLIFIKAMHLKLWDYSDRKWNFKGLICPTFSLIWLVVGCIYYFLINPFIVKYVLWISDNLVFGFFIGIIMGMMLVDTCYSIHLGMKLKKASGNLTVRLENFKENAKSHLKPGTKNNGSLGEIVHHLSINNLLHEYITKQSNGEKDTSKSASAWLEKYQAEKREKKAQKELEYKQPNEEQIKGEEKND